MKTIWLTGAAVLALSTPAFAQDTTTAGTSADAGVATPPADPTQTDEQATPGDIVVTAQKRSERLQDVPVAVSVISGDAIAAKGAVNLEAAQYLVPTLNFRKSGTAINQSLFLRGVGTSTFSIAGEPSISTVVDGVVYSRAGEAFSDLIDIDRLEVLRGPQGTLFGKNTSAGVINIVTKRPGQNFGGFLEGAYYFDNGNEYRVRGALDLPLTTGVAARVTGFYGNYDGNIRNTVYNTRVNGYEHYGVRGVLVAEPTPDLTLTLIGDYRKSNDDCCGEVIGTGPINNTTGAPATSLAFAALPTPKGDKTRGLAQDLVTSTIEKSWGVSGQADYTLGTQTVTYIGSYREYDNTEIREHLHPGAAADQPGAAVLLLRDRGLLLARADRPGVHAQRRRLHRGGRADGADAVLDAGADGDRADRHRGVRIGVQEPRLLRAGHAQHHRPLPRDRRGALHDRSARRVSQPRHRAGRAGDQPELRPGRVQRV